MKISLRRIHKFLGLSAGVIILVLSISGFVLNHENWKFLNNITFTNVPSETYKLNNRSFNSYFIDERDKNHIIVSGSCGLFETHDGLNFKKQLDEVCYDIREHDNTFYVATANGIYRKNNSSNQWDILILEGKYISSLNISNEKLIIVEDKKVLYVYDLLKKTIIEKNVSINDLNEDINLSRLVRDLHYGRGLFDGDISLYINDISALLLIVLFISGFLFWIFIKLLKGRKYLKSSVKSILSFHSNILMIIFIIPILLLSITGIFLDHSNVLQKFMNSIKISNNILPPVYHTLKSDIWGAGYYNNDFYIGNRYGIYKSKDLENFTQVSKGFAYKIIHKNNKLYISGMGAKNRVIDGEKLSILENTPHMFKDINIIDGKEEFFSVHSKENVLPVVNDVSLYNVMLSMHNGSFFSSWWIWINDYANLAIIVLMVTGIYRWYLRKKLYFSKYLKLTIN